MQPATNTPDIRKSGRKLIPYITNWTRNTKKNLTGIVTNRRPTGLASRRVGETCSLECGASKPTFEEDDRMYSLFYTSVAEGESWWHWTYDTYKEAAGAAHRLFDGDKDYRWWIKKAD
jgi:hypothetical protein